MIVIVSVLLRFVVTTKHAIENTGLADVWPPRRLRSLLWIYPKFEKIRSIEAELAGADSKCTARLENLFKSSSRQLSTTELVTASALLLRKRTVETVLTVYQMLQGVAEILDAEP